MKKVLFLSALALTVNSAMAAETAVLKVTGTLTNAACTPTLSNGGVVDYGTLRLGELSATSVNSLPNKAIDLTINCTSATKVAWDGMDNQASSRPSPALPVNAGSDLATPANTLTFGMGKTDGGVNIGNYIIRIDTAPVYDGISGLLITHNTDWGNVWNTSGNAQRNDGYSWYTAAQTGTTEPVAFKTATFALSIRGTIQDTTTLAVTDDTAINGQATFTLRYL